MNTNFDGEQTALSSITVKIIRCGFIAGLVSAQALNLNLKFPRIKDI